MNVQQAIDALRDDGLKLVNIGETEIGGMCKEKRTTGSHDVVEGNHKLLLGLIWCLILRYQIASRTRVPPKKLLLAWVNTAIPELHIRNFSSDWNNGVALRCERCYLKEYV